MGSYYCTLVPSPLYTAGLSEQGPVERRAQPNFVYKIQNPGQSCRPSIDLKTWKIWKLNKDFKKVGPICGNLSYKSQLTKVWAVLSWNLPKKLPKEGPYWHFFLSNWCGNLTSNLNTLYKAVCPPPPGFSDLPTAQLYYWPLPDCLTDRHISFPSMKHVGCNYLHWALSSQQQKNAGTYILKFLFC